MTLRDELYALVTYGAVCTVRDESDGFTVHPWAVDWALVEDDDRTFSYCLTGADEYPHTGEVDRVERDDATLIIHTRGEPDEPGSWHELRFDAYYQPSHKEQLDRWAARRAGVPAPEGAARYATI